VRRFAYGRSGAPRKPNEFMINTYTKELSENLKQGLGMSETEMTELYKRLVNENKLGAVTVLKSLEKLRQVLIEISEINFQIKN